ncbi:hypothetical protein [Thomasclavelia cocleata]|nr:hypothetical protein [Thomasclavelia cocleata]
MDEHNISVEEVMKIIHKDRSWIINAIERGVFPGSVTVSPGGRRNPHIPRKAFWDYMEHDHVLTDGKYIEEAAKRVAEKALNEFMPLFLHEIKKAVAGTTTNQK